MHQVGELLQGKPRDANGADLAATLGANALSDAVRAVEVRLLEIPDDSIDIDLAVLMAEVTRQLERLLETVGDHSPD